MNELQTILAETCTRLFTDHATTAVLEGAAQVFHLAAQAGVRASWGDDFVVYTDNNVLATQRLLEAAVAARVPRLVYASSSSVYGDSTVLPLHEAAACRPVSPYGVTKLAAEHLANLYHSNMGMPVVSLRYFTVYGPRQRPDMAFHRFLKAARDGSPIHLFGDGRQTRDFTYVDDIVEGVVRTLDLVPQPDPNWSSDQPDPASSSAPYRLYNIGNNEPVELLQFVEVIERALGRKAERQMLPMQPGDVPRTYADVDDLMREIDFRPSTPLAHGIAQFIAWYRDYHRV